MVRNLRKELENYTNRCVFFPLLSETFSTRCSISRANAGLHCVGVSISLFFSSPFLEDEMGAPPHPQIRP